MTQDQQTGHAVPTPSRRSAAEARRTRPPRGRQGQLSPTVHDTAARCQAWLAHQAEACRLSFEWGQVEARLQAEHGWYRMPKAERERHPGQAELDAIQSRLEKLDVMRDALLPTLADLPATTRETVALKLAVVAELVDVADFPEAHALVTRAREEMLEL